MEKINVAELLKDCPKGMELDCTLFENVSFVRVDMSKRQFPIEIAVSGIRSKYLTKEGCFHDTTLLPESKCVIFPKGKTTWEGFVPSCKFKDGDILITAHGNPFILKDIDNNKICESYCGIRQNGEFVIGSTHWTSNYDLRFATEEEKEKLFKAIKDNGYRWNANTKTLEKLIEPKFNVGDKVQHKGATSCASVYEVEKMRVVDNRMEYTIKLLWHNNCSITVAEEDLQPYKEETMEEQKKDYEEWFPTDYLEFENNDNTWADEVEINLGKDYEIQIRGDKTFIVKKKPQYPKTYEECIGLLPINWDGNVEGYKCQLLLAFQKLLICRDAYWKIAGEEMGLDKPWEPDYDSGVNKYGIICMNGVVQESNPTTNWERHLNKILDFPTEKIRDAFYENFKELIEECKTFL